MKQWKEANKIARQDKSKANIERIAIVLQRPASEKLEVEGKSEKYSVLKEHNATLRASLIEWLEQKGLSEYVYDVSVPTAFGILFVTATPDLIERLSKAPGVESASIEPEFKFDLPRPKAIWEEDDEE